MRRSPDVDALDCQQPIHLLHAMLGQRDPMAGQAAPHGKDCQALVSTPWVALEGQHPFGMQVAFIQGGDEVQEVVSPEPLPG